MIRYLIIVLTGIIYSCGIPTDNNEITTKDQMKADLEGDRLWSRELKKRISVYEEALEKGSLTIIASSLKLYEDAEELLGKVKQALDRFNIALERQKERVARVREIPSPGQQQTYLEKKEELNKTQEAVQQAEFDFLQNLKEGGFRLYTPEARLQEMEEDVFTITAQMIKLESEIEGRRKTVAEFLGVKDRERKLVQLGRELNEIEELYARVLVQRKKLDKIVRLATRDLRRVDYYWMGNGFPEKDFDRAFTNNVRKTESLVEELSQLLDQ